MHEFAGGAVRALAACIVFVCAGCGVERPPDRISGRIPVDDPRFGEVMGSLLGPPLVSGNSCTTLLNGDEIFPAMLGAIKSAHRSITLETYVYWSGSIGQQFADALCERAKAGVAVDVIMDWFGSSKMSPALLRELKEGGVKVSMFHPFEFWNPATWGHVDNRTHRKIMVVDGRVGFTGGVGIADLWQGNADRPDHWRDNHYRIEGPVVAQLQSAFMDNWATLHGVVPVGEAFFPALTPTGNLRAQVFKSSATSGSESMQLMALLSIRGASHNIRIETAYFVPDAITQYYLIDARHRGVSVEIIIPGPHLDQKLVELASRREWGDLLKAGVALYDYQPTMFHCKQMIVDDQWISIGSSNFDNRSFRLNDECNLNVLDRDFAVGQIAVFEHDKSNARRITYEQWLHRPLVKKIADFFSRLLDQEL